jgi:Ser/Thr protein kinase RdoA (MazF antagonist)
LSFIDQAAGASSLRAAWLDAYTAIRPLAAVDLAIIDAMVLLRRVVLLAWIGTHGETQLAQAHAASFAADTARAGRRWLEQA